MRITLKGLHRVRARLTGGRLVSYFYAWRGGPRLVGEPGSAEFLASYTAAHANWRQPNAATFISIIAGYRGSRDFLACAPRTRADYMRHLTKIETAFGSLPLAALDDPRITRDFLEWRDGMAAASPRQADYAWTILVRVLSWARTRGLTLYRPPERIERLYHGDRAEKIWTEAHVAAFMAVAPQPLQLALLLALETGQRQGDLLALPWSSYDGAWIRLRQRKTGRTVNVPVTRRLRAVLENTPRRAITVLTNGRGTSWHPGYFRNAWGKATRAAGISDLTFHDLRGTSVTRLAEAGCSHAEIAAITGHGLRDVGSILDKYLARTDKLAVAAIAKLERGRPNEDRPAPREAAPKEHTGDIRL